MLTGPPPRFHETWAILRRTTGRHSLRRKDTADTSISGATGTFRQLATTRGCGRTRRSARPTLEPDQTQDLAKQTRIVEQIFANR
jgi:hypothetical protein